MGQVEHVLCTVYGQIPGHNKVEELGVTNLHIFCLVKLLENLLQSPDSRSILKHHSGHYYLCTTVYGI